MMVFTRFVGAVCILLAILGAACGGEGPPRTVAIERLAFVLRGKTTLGAGVYCECPEDLVVDRHEVTRARWLQAVGAAGVHALPRPFGTDWVPPTLEWPATGMNLEEARAFAAARGMRLPTVEEWMWIAAGPRGQRFPYAHGAMVSVANTAELGLRRLAPVGTFHGGRTPNTAVFDLLGNAWEWVQPGLPTVVRLRQNVDRTGLEGVRTPIQPLYPALDGPSPFAGWAMGGSYLFPAHELHGIQDGRVFFLARGLEPGHRSIDLGLRCVAGARDYLWEHAAEWDDRRLRARMMAVGRSPSWRRAAPLLEELAARPGAPRSLAWMAAGARE